MTTAYFQITEFRYDVSASTPDDYLQQWTTFAGDGVDACDGNPIEFDIQGSEVILWENDVSMLWEDGTLIQWEN